MQELNEKTVSDIEKEGGIAYGFKCDVSNREEVKKISNKVSCNLIFIWA